MITDRHIFVVRQKWIVGPENLADIGGVMDAHVEVGLIADPRREMQHTIGRAVQ